MVKEHRSEISILIKASSSRVWEALIDPEMVKQYMIGTDLTTDWKVGSLIRWDGFLQGKRYLNKGIVLSVVPESLLEYTYWSSVSNLKDDPENYTKVSCKLSKENGGTRLTITIDDKNATEEGWNHALGGWRLMLNGIKNLLETQS